MTDLEKLCHQRPVDADGHIPDQDLGLSQQVSAAQVPHGLRRRSTATTPEPAPPASTTHATGHTSGQAAGHVRNGLQGVRWVLVCMSLYLSVFMYGLDTTIAADVQGAVIETLGNVDQLAWLGAGFPLGSVAVSLPYSALFTSFNMKWLYISGIVLFQAGSALCGAAPSMGALVVGRIIAGAGGTGMYLGALTQFSALTTVKERGTYITGIAFNWGIGSVLGPVIGGAFSVSRATWRWAFYINLLIGAATAPIYLIFLPAIRPATTLTVRQRLLSLDYVGFAVSAAVWAAFALGLVSAGTLWAWRDARTIATLVVFGVLLAAYVLQQYFCWWTTPATRSFPAHVLRNHTHILLYIATSASITTLYIPAYYIPVFFQFVQNDSALMAAVRLLPFILVTVAVNLASGFMLARIRYYKVFYLASGTCLTLAGALLFVYLHPSTPTGVIYSLLVVGGIGTGLTLQIGFAVASLIVDVNDIGNAISIQNISQIGSSTICLAVAGQIFQSVAVRNLSAALAGTGFTSADIQSIVAGAQSPLFQQLDGPLRDRTVQAITKAIQSAFTLDIVAGGVLTIAAVFMKWEKLFGEISTA